MEILASALALIVVAVAFTFLIRDQDIPSVAPISPTHHLEERRAAIYENLRDLQFEYRVGKLSDADYAQTKLALQKELGVVVAETEHPADQTHKFNLTILVLPTVLQISHLINRLRLYMYQMLFQHNTSLQQINLEQ